MKFLTAEKKECRTVIRLFGHTIFRFGEKRRGIYDMKSILEKYTGVKTNIKKYEIQHGWMDTVSNYDLKKDIDLMLVWSKTVKQDWQSKSKIQCEIIPAPFVLYRRMNNITQNPNAKGTIAYPLHSTNLLKPNFDIKKYCEELKALPEEFQPVTVSLHHSDIEEHGLDKEYEKYGIKTVCASFNQGNKQFYEAFYDILRSYKYATSNAAGTCLFYAIEMGIPFFIYGEASYFDNTSGADKNSPAKVFNVNDFAPERRLCEMFDYNKFNGITQEQRDIVEYNLGLKDGLSKDELIKVLKKVKK